MKAYDGLLRSVLGRYLTEEVPSVDLWPRLRHRLASSWSSDRLPEARLAVRRRFLVVAAVVGAAMLGTVITAMAASPRAAVLHFVNAAAKQVGIEVGPSTPPNRRTVRLTTQSFRLLVPQYVPPTLINSEYAYIPERSSVTSSPTGGIKSVTVDKSLVLSGPGGPSERAHTAVHSLATAGLEAAWLRYSSPSGGYVEVVEQAAAVPRKDSVGTPMSVNGNTAIIHETSEPGAIELTVVQSGTHVAIRTNLGLAEAVKVAQSLV